MRRIEAGFVGVELYFENLEGANQFYVERKGAESYPSKDKAVLFFEVPALKSAIDAIGRDRFVQCEPAWAILHDPEGHNVVLLQRS